MSDEKKKVQALLQEIEARPGWATERAKRGHWKIRHEGRLVTVLPVSPSDWRSLKNARAVLRRAGFE